VIPHRPLELRGGSGEKLKLDLEVRGGAGEDKISITLQRRRFPRTLAQAIDAKQLCKNCLPTTLKIKTDIENEIHRKNCLRQLLEKSDFHVADVAKSSPIISTVAH